MSKKAKTMTSTSEQAPHFLHGNGSSVFKASSKTSFIPSGNSRPVTSTAESQYSAALCSDRLHCIRR